VALFTYEYDQVTGSVGPIAHTTTPAYIDENGSQTTNAVTFDITTSTNTTHWVIDFGDGTYFPANADPDEDDLNVITGAGANKWAVYSSTKIATHQYAITTQDLEKDVVLHVFSLTAGAQGALAISSTLNMRIMKDYTGLISFTASPTIGNNDTASYNTSTNSKNYEGIYTELTPALSGGNAVTGSYGTRLSWDLTNALNSTSGQIHAYSAVLTQQDIVLKRTDNTTAPDSQTRTVTLTITSEHTSSPFAGGNTDITIKRDPRADFTGQFDTLSTGYSGSSNQKGYIFTDYNGAARNILTFADGSDVNGITGWSWDVDKNVSAGADYTIQNPQHTYSATGSHTVELTLNHPNTYGSGDIDYIKEITSYITISSNPTVPDTLQGKTLSLTSTHSNTPYLCSSFTDNSDSNPYAQDAQVTRSTSLVPETDPHDFANEFPSDGNNTGNVKAVINGIPEAGADIKTFTTGDDSDTTGSLIITTDVDASDPSTSWNNTIPLLWYRVFKSKVKSKSNLSIGVNEYEVEQLFGSATRKTAILPFVIDTMTNTPSCSAFTVDMTGASSGTPRYMSSIVYFNAGSPTFKVSALTVTDLSGHTYAKNVNPVQVVNNGGSLLSSSQDLSYANLSISTPVPVNNSPTVGGLVSVPSGSSYGIGTVKVRARNVNGWGSYQTDSTNILYWFSTVNLNEQNMTNSIANAGTPITNQTNLIRVVGFDSSSATPVYTAVDFYANNAWVSQTTSLGIYEPPLLNTGGGQFTWDNTNWQTYLPGLTSNPNLSSRTAGTQYVTLAFCRTGLIGTGSFRIKYTGEISSLHLALPGAGTDASSGLNGWLDCNDAVSFGYPGSGTGGNNDDGVRHATVPGSGALGVFKNEGIFNISLNQASTGESGSITNNSVVLIRFGLSGTGKYVSAIAVEDYS